MRRPVVHGRSRPLRFDARVEGALRREEWRASAVLLAALGVVLGGAIVVGCAIARGLGLLVDAHVPAPEPTAEAWVARAVLALALASVGGIAAWAIGGMR
jgi:hypothetical protein